MTKRTNQTSPAATAWHIFRNAAPVVVVVFCLLQWHVVLAGCAWLAEVAR